MALRLYIEDDAQVDTQDEFDRAKDWVGEFLPAKDKPNIFDTTVFDAMFKGEEVFEAIKKHDEIFCSTSLVPQMGCMGSPMLFNGMMHKAIEENVTGKTIYILNRYKSIWWDELRKELVDKAFKKNYLYTLNADETGFEQVDIDALVRSL